VYPWKDLGLASDMNSGLWVFRVRRGRDPAPSDGAPAAVGQPATPEPTSGSDPVRTLSTVVLVLGLLAAALAVRRARRHRAG
jgi:hypothetical protein